MKTKSRFVSIYKEGSAISGEGIRNILVDTETGVNYLWIISGYAGGLTPLLDAYGNVVISRLPVED